MMVMRSRLYFWKICSEIFQSQAILDMQLKEIIRLNVEKLEEEYPY